MLCMSTMRVVRVCPPPLAQAAGGPVAAAALEGVSLPHAVHTALGGGCDVHAALGAMEPA
jgi:hypothetical protein